MTNCPCGSGRTFDACCGPVIGGTPAPTAEALMRSRYSAFATGNVEYLSKTLSTEARSDFDAAEAQNTADSAKWLGLEVRATSGGGEKDETGSGRVRRALLPERPAPRSPRTGRLRARGRPLGLHHRPDQPQGSPASDGQGRPQRTLPLRLGEEIQEVLRSVRTEASD